MKLAEYEKFLQSWNGTPYMNGKDYKGVGIDCVRFACRVLDYLHGFDAALLSPVPVMKSDVSLHNPRKALRIIRFMAERFSHDVIAIRGDTDNLVLRPGDVIVTETGKECPGHILVVGPTGEDIWHSYNISGVRMTGIGWCRQAGIWKVWRPSHLLLEQQ